MEKQPYENHILIVDDEAKNIQLLAYMLQDSGYAIEFATNGAEALHWMNTRSFDLILLDIMMPDMNGFEVCQQLKSNPGTADIPVIFLTAKTDLESIIQGFKVGAVDYLTKPIRKNELLARVKTHIDLVSQRRTLKTLANELKEKNEELSQTNLTLADHIAMKDKFFSIIAHDIKNPLVGFLSYSMMLQKEYKDKGDDQFKLLADQVKTSAENLYELLDNLLTWSQLQNKMIEFLPTPTRVYDIAQRNIQLVTPNANLKHIKIEDQIDKNIISFSDKSMLDSIFRNLLTNAVKFTHENGSIIVSASRNEKVITCQVEDSGVGIPAEYLATIFRIDARHRRKGTKGELGTGLGLILCKEFVEKNQGQIWAESELNKGSRFYFTLPLYSPT